MTYWDMDEYQVEDVMTEFLKKSLAQSEFDSTLGTSISVYPNYIFILSYFYSDFIQILSREIVFARSLVYHSALS